MQLLKEMGVDAYRISIAWSRIFPTGTGEINQAGVDHYNNLINAIINIEAFFIVCYDAGIKPYDLPQALEDKYGGWLDGHIRKDFALFTETCFEKFGDRVKHWITFNEPHTFAIQGYYKGNHAPGHRSSVLSKVGDPTTEPYIVAQYAIRCHATAADIYRRNYEDKQNGLIGIPLDAKWYAPQTMQQQTLKQLKEPKIFSLAGFLTQCSSEINYPSSMRTNVGDFVGINHFTTYYSRGNATNSDFDYLNDCISDANAFAIRVDDTNNITPIEDALKDWLRIKYHTEYLTNLLAAI
ncbi:beta-glucosidase 40-like [Gossypium australe]|uniref:Beta-glucosidase 40-like n=1 Tax=Gossypium australe TaxID=47621 RepID=A0A5B6X4Z0_9ROSI|nr:beta-glucosidase 40-like [Gossypium australe]